jgi:hypothetical protein
MAAYLSITDLAGAHAPSRVDDGALAIADFCRSVSARAPKVRAGLAVAREGARAFPDKTRARYE